MKYLITVILIVLFSSTLLAQDKNAKASIEVDGVCMMCKERIEKQAIKTKGVKSASWNVQTHILSLIFDESKTNIQTIEESIAAVGHDTKNVKATEEAYEGLHHCCKYRNDKVKEEHNN